ncbi:hypothetical protein PPSIR1_10470 [Plesiocystis pacifica SIR-1]|uniref:FAD dependent oxidoreductase domain-containing protein n=1 Tax=Plesiocystis pacifica SIR-1 TaxID=391625 RepID=A6GI65_9BACT|nr:hypothetical protein PPSIR1_10470 [Plesiocystis pacifica SIR-1]
MKTHAKERNRMGNLGPSKGNVTVYGGGVAGLTVAHELITRGYAVTLIEPTLAPDRFGQSHVRVGGMAASQMNDVDPHHHVHDSVGTPASDDPPRPKSKLGPVWLAADDDSDKGHSVGACHQPGSAALTASDKQALSDLVPKLGEDYTLGITGMVHIGRDNIYDASQGRILARQRAGSVAAFLVEQGLDRTKLSLRGANVDPLRCDDTLGSWTTTQSVTLPGEHGYRYFPSFYRHVFDTMGRTPLYDSDGMLSARTVYDNLESSLSVTVARKHHDPILFSMVPPTNIQEMRESLIATLASTGATGLDLLLISLRMLRYLSTCSARREALYENVSLLDFLQARHPDRPGPDVVYSPSFLDYLETAPRILAAIDPATGDARTNANIAVQLMQPDNGTRINGTLNGPTSTAWFDPWVEHLDALRVRFLGGKLTQMTVVDGKLHVELELEANPKVDPERFEPVTETSPCGETVITHYIDHADYIVTAFDAATAERLSAELPDVGVPEKLRGYAEARVPPPPEWSGKVEVPEQGWRRFQTMSGIQYFFRETVDIATGHVYFSDSDWGLSSISEQQFWAAEPNLNTNGYASLISVDIGDFETPSAHLGKPARECTAEEIAKETWRQILEVIDPAPQLQLPVPTWYHLDDNLAFAGDAGEGLFQGNATPLQVPLAGDWHRRPGGDPFDPVAVDGPADSPPDLPQGVWQSPMGGYYVHWDRLLYAGTWKKTFTRITTMEAANESGRHVVNAILAHTHEIRGHGAFEGEPPIPVDHSAPKHTDPVEREQTGKSVGRSALNTGVSGIIGQNPVGAFCRIWNPEQHEMASFVPLKELDAMLFEQGLPHLFDVLMLETTAQAWSQLGLRPFAATPNIQDLQRWTAEAVKWQQSATAAMGLAGTPAIHDALIHALRSLRGMLEQFLAPMTPTTPTTPTNDSSEAST